MMDSTRQQQRKRKSRGSDIFEVSERDLSPEPEEHIEDEPEPKFLRSERFDVADSCQKNEGLNLENSNISSQELDNTKEIDIFDGTERKDELMESQREEIEESSATIVLEETQNEDALEDGEVNDLTLVPCISITFSNKSVADIYKQKFCKFIQSFVELEISLENETSLAVIQNTNLNPEDWVVLDNTIGLLANDSLSQNVENAKKKKRKKKQKELFVLDTKREINTNGTKLKYSTKFVIDDGTELQKSKGSPAPQKICFNCEKQHGLLDCPEPKNFKRISMNKQTFMAKIKPVRYHLEADQKFGHLQAGKLSPNLRKALGLKKNQIPSYIYYMRVEGYPPGWLEEAKLTHSELNMFDIDGNSVRNTTLPRTKGLDPEKVISYPGFNIPFDKDCKDESEYHRVPPYSKEYGKDKMIEFYQQKCMKEEDDFQTQDMELDNANDFSDMDFSRTKLKLTDVQKETDSNDVPSPSLIDLEQEKNSLLAELQNSVEVNSWDCQSDENTVSSLPDRRPDNNDTQKDEETKEPKEKGKEILKERKESGEGEEKGENTTDQTINNCLSPINVNNLAKVIKNSEYGTPILKSSSPYNHLPQLDNFTKGVSAVIDFENLPNSTGKYEQMYGVLQKVRDTLKSIHKT